MLFVFFITLSGAATLAFPFASSRIIIDLTAGNYDAMVRFAVVLFGLVAIYVFFEILARWIGSKIIENTSFDIRRQLSDRVMSMRLAEVYDRGSGYFLERLGEDTMEVSGRRLTIYEKLIDILMNLGFISYITVLNPLLGMVFVAGLVVLIFLEYYSVAKRLQNSKVLKKTREAQKSVETELLKGIKEIKGLGSREALLEKHSVANRKTTNARYKMAMFNNKMSGVISLVKGMIDLSILLFAGLFLLPNGQIELAAVLVVYNYKGNIYGLISSFAYIKDNYVNGELSAKRLNEVLQASDTEMDTFGEDGIDNEIESIELRKVAFEYKPGVPVLRDISLEIKKNSLVGFVGKSGCGKSTIFSLLTNFYRAQSGAILVNNNDYYNLSENAVRNTFTPVLQDPYIFNDTILSNVRFARVDATDEQVIEACKKALLHDEIMAFANGYNTMIGESGSNLSGGQKQRLEIARALLKDSPVLLFDEATSALDRNNLLQINALMKELAKEKIVMVIAHRLGVMRTCDIVFVVDEGRIIASGTHEELLESCEYYKELFKRRTEAEAEANK